MRLIDADNLEECKEVMTTIHGECKYAVRMDDIRNMPTITVERPHGEWIDVPKYKGFYVCSKCLERLDGDFERFDHWEMKKENFCPVCGSDNRKRGEKNEC